MAAAEKFSSEDTTTPILKPSLPPILRYGIFPVYLFGGLALAVFGQSAGLSEIVLFLSIIGPLGLILMALEYTYPRQAEWKLTKIDFLQDIWFLVVGQIQGAVIMSLKVFIVTVGGAWLAAKFIPPSQLWPHHWPALAQAGLALVVFTFCRYWYHRAMHQPGKLWECHALHHSVEKFSWLKSVWGHPLDGIPMDLIGTLPLMLLGISPSVLVLMVIPVSIIGMLAHTTLDLRTGWFRYIFVTIEVHEVHHTDDIPGEGHNFCDAITLWDHVFGTYHVDVARIGTRKLGFYSWPKHLPKPARIWDLYKLPFHR